VVSAVHLVVPSRPSRLAYEDDAVLSRAITTSSLEDRRDDVLEVIWTAMRDRLLAANPTHLTSPDEALRGHLRGRLRRLTVSRCPRRCRRSSVKPSVWMVPVWVVWMETSVWALSVESLPPALGG
jgi:hypothetical protein